MIFFVRPKLPTLLFQANGEMFVLNWLEVLGLVAELTFKEKLLFLLSGNASLSSLTVFYCSTISLSMFGKFPLLLGERDFS